MRIASFALAGACSRLRLRFLVFVLVLLSINYNNSFSDGTLYYSNVMLALTVDESIEREIGQIELWDGYRDLLVSILKKVVPYTIWRLSLTSQNKAINYRHLIN